MNEKQLNEVRSEITASQTSLSAPRLRTIGPEAVRKIIFDAFRVFRDVDLQAKKLKQLEQIVFEDCYSLAPSEAAHRILNVLETTQVD